jgi:hypothetical protein
MPFMSIHPPGKPLDHPDRFLDCQQALEPAFQNVVERATAAGWEEVEVVAALVTLADHHMLARGENIALDELLADLRRRLGR